MAWPKGKPRPDTWGRKKGTPNKKSLPLAERAAAMGVDPFEILLRFAAGDWKGLGYSNENIMTGVDRFGIAVTKPTIDPGLRERAAEGACEYLHPKRKAIEVTGTEGDDLKIQYKVNWADETDPGNNDPA